MALPQSNKPKTNLVNNDSLIESLRDLGHGVGKTVSHDVAAKIGGDVLASLTGSIPKSGELKANQAVEFTTEKQTTRTPVRRSEALRPTLRREDFDVKAQIEAVRAELKALATSVKQLHQEVTKSVMEVPVAPGIYHVNFYEQLRSFLLVLRQRVDDSRSWLSTWNTRKQKIGYWGLYKKHGTQFGLSSERTIATQAG